MALEVEWGGYFYFIQNTKLIKVEKMQWSCLDLIFSNFLLIMGLSNFINLLTRYIRVA